MAVQLARKSLLEIDLRATPTQYVMMKTVREYGREQLQKTPDLNFAHCLHALYYLDVTANRMKVFGRKSRGSAPIDDASICERTRSIGLVLGYA